MINLVKRICLRIDVLIGLMQQLHATMRTTGDRTVEREVTPVDELLDIEDVIKLLGISISTYYRMVQRGDLCPRRKGKRHYYYRSDLYLHRRVDNRSNGHGDSFL